MIKKGMLLVLLVFSVGAFAEGPCKDDVEKLCPGIEKGDGRIARCLKEKESEVSAVCKEHRAKMKTEVKEAHSACQADIEAHCASVEKGKGRIMKCLKENKDKLSESCRSSLSDVRKMRKGK